MRVSSQVIFASLTLAAPAWATEPPQVHWVVGSAIAVNPSYAGADSHRLRPRPLWAVDYGRFRFSTSRGNSLASFGLPNDRPGQSSAGASARLIERDDFSLHTSLTTESGRDPEDAPQLVGSARIRPTLRAQLGMSYTLDRHWSTHLSLSQDILGRQGGLQMSGGLNYSVYSAPSTRWNLGASLSAGNGRYMQTHHGLPASASQAGFEASAGFNNVSLGAEVTTALSARWVVFGGLRVSRLLGDAARSPLTERATTWGGSVGLAYRCCP